MVATVDSAISLEGGSNRSQAPLAVLTDIYQQRNRGLRSRTVPQVYQMSNSPIYPGPLRRIESAPVVARGPPRTSATMPNTSRHEYHYRYNTGRHESRQGSSTARDATRRNRGAPRGSHLASPPPSRTMRPSTQRHTARHQYSKPPPAGLVEPELSSRSTGTNSSGVVSTWEDLGDGLEPIPVEGLIRPIVAYTHHCGCGGYVFRKHF
ncbi:hypothetical protein Pmar_PMAR014520 [Perkinsus marinus ATCC 50983]|uniref:Uncharacterized protein n=1 Tax=Perkinsus marinus (strain ATCC 50983 / TXsc) TaxID=423536 RepID=C5KWA8_PERM5|nr:hypothetical protein Pmar_PMAR014520 [Perkinsus marinus ATCC 50983]EER11219.1 hypothetical protein Pmar_PMAR014520 [Perkinsus marinus ATCC 50983]|eukprot:XP_002779424.1 hypothetical protein Pmar_PMAR014520 [Perkinsus marinus ATCC 50983]